MKQKFENYKIKPELTCSIIVVCLIFLIEFILACINKSWYTSVNLIIPLSKTIFRYCLNFTSIIIIIKSSKFTFLHSSLQSLFIFTLWFRPQRECLWKKGGITSFLGHMWNIHFPTHALIIIGFFFTNSFSPITLCSDINFINNKVKEVKVHNKLQIK